MFKDHKINQKDQKDTVRLSGKYVSTGNITPNTHWNKKKEETLQINTYNRLLTLTMLINTMCPSTHSKWIA